MKEILVNKETLTEAYHESLLQLYHNSEETECPDYNQKQKECALTFVVQNPKAEPRISKLVIGGPYELQQYVMEVVDGILNFRIGHGWAYTYNQRIMEQYDFIIQELKRNPFSRRAIIAVRDWKYDVTNDSPACLQSMQYFIRNNKLHCCILFRSNDLVEATFFNAFALIQLQEKIANALGVEVGSYSHRANSMHCYEKDYKTLEGFVKAIEKKDLNSLSYNYEEFYKDIMLENVPKILDQVKILKNNINQIEL